MSSNFPGGGGPDFYTAAGGGGGGGGGGGFTNGRSNSMMSGNNPQLPYRSAAIVQDPLPPVDHRRTDLIGKRSFAELQHHQLLYQQQQFQRNLNLGNLFNFRNVKPRQNYQQNSPVDFSDMSSFSPEMSSFSNNSLNPRYGLPVLHQFNPLNRINNFQNPSNNGNFIPNSVHNKFFQQTGFNMGHESISISSNSVQNQRSGLNTGQELDQPEKKMMNQLQELEKQLLGDDENDNGSGGGDAVSVVTNSEWSDIQNLNFMCPQKPISLSPTSSSSSSSCSSTPTITCPKQLISDAATAISEGKTEGATENLTRLFQVSNSKGSSEQRLMFFMAAALQSRLKPAEFPPPVSEIYSKEHLLANQMLYEVSPCFKLGFMAANRAILEAVNSQEKVITVHVIDFDIGQGGQYVHLLHALAAGNIEKRVGLRITTFSDTFSAGDERLTVVSDGLKVLANKLGVCFDLSVINSKIHDLSPEKLGVKEDEVLVVNFAFKLYKLPDESVTTENLRDELLRRVKGLSPKVVTVVEQEMNANTAPLVARVNENYSYYSVLFDSLDATVSKESHERVKIEEGLSRSIINSVACEGRDRVERCEVFGKWRARMSMAGFKPEPISPLVADSLRSKLNSGTRGNPGFTVNEQSGGISFGWKGRTLTIASAWH